MVFCLVEVLSGLIILIFLSIGPGSFCTNFASSESWLWFDVIGLDFTGLEGSGVDTTVLSWICRFKLSSSFWSDSDTDSW